MKALIVNNWGRMTVQDLPEVVAASTEITVRVEYAGVGFADVMAVRGGYPLAPKRPFSPGYEFFGKVEQVGSDVRNFKKGQRVVGILPLMGAYREVVALDPVWAVAVPDEVDGKVAALLPLNYLTAWALLKMSTNIQAGQKILVHGASGGVGSAVLELAKYFGIVAYGTASKSKFALVQQLGGRPLDYRESDWLQEVLQQEPAGLDAVFDPFGGQSLERSWKAVGQRGTLVSFGFSPTIDGGFVPMILGSLSIALKNAFGGSRKATICGTPGLMKARPNEYRAALNELLALTARGVLNPRLHEVLPWKKAAEAHEVLADRQVRGKLLLDFTQKDL